MSRESHPDIQSPQTVRWCEVERKWLLGREMTIDDNRRGDDIAPGRETVYALGNLDNWGPPRVTGPPDNYRSRQHRAWQREPVLTVGDLYDESTLIGDNETVSRIREHFLGRNDPSWSTRPVTDYYTTLLRRSRERRTDAAEDEEMEHDYVMVPSPSAHLIPDHRDHQGTEHRPLSPAAEARRRRGGGGGGGAEREDLAWNPRSEEIVRRAYRLWRTRRQQRHEGDGGTMNAGLDYPSRRTTLTTNNQGRATPRERPHEKRNKSVCLPRSRSPTPTTTTTGGGGGGGGGGGLDPLMRMRAIALLRVQQLRLNHHFREAQGEGGHAVIFGSVCVTKSGNGHGRAKLQPRSPARVKLRRTSLAHGLGSRMDREHRSVSAITPMSHVGESLDDTDGGDDDEGRYERSPPRTRRRIGAEEEPALSLQVLGRGIPSNSELRRALQDDPLAGIMEHDDEDDLTAQVVTPGEEEDDDDAPRGDVDDFVYWTIYRRQMQRLEREEDSRPT